MTPGIIVWSLLITVPIDLEFESPFSWLGLFVTFV
jgi:hypothetical protein